MASLLAPTAVATVVVIATAAAVLAATAEAAGSYYMIPTPATPDFLFSPVFLWVTANVIIVWLFSSSRRGSRTTKDAAATHDDGEVVVPGGVDSYYASSSEYDAFSDAAPSGRRADAPPVAKRHAREARAARRSDRPRVRKKPAGVQDAPAAVDPWGAVASEARDEREPRRGERRGREEMAAPVTVVAATDTEPMTGDGVGEDEEDVSMDTLWASILQRRAARPVVVQKSESWGNHELPELQRVAETAVARREMRKSVSAVGNAAAAPTPTPPAAPPPAVGWRTRDVLVGITPDELLRRAESFIRRQRDHLRLQRQESEQRQLLLQRRLPAV